jgi:hypothetical protein
MKVIQWDEYFDTDSLPEKIHPKLRLKSMIFSLFWLEGKNEESDEQNIPSADPSILFLLLSRGLEEEF